MRNKGKSTIVHNILDDRSHVFSLPAHEAVVAAYECFDRKRCGASYLDPRRHPAFREHKRGYSCGDWIAYRQADEDQVVEHA
ncbi:MAG: hypothetical protein WAW37_06770 [Syntrophobacteraceae bacterium]